MNKQQDQDLPQNPYQPNPLREFDHEITMAQRDGYNRAVRDMLAAGYRKVPDLKMLSSEHLYNAAYVSIDEFESLSSPVVEALQRQRVAQAQLDYCTRQIEESKPS